jgi:hypothetical protein
MSSQKPVTFAVAGIVAVLVAVGAYMLGNSGSRNATAGAATAAAVRPPGTPQAPAAGQPPQNGQAPPGFGTPVTGATADKVKAAALAKYKGSVERVMKLADGSYEAHVLTPGGEYHVTVGKDFKVTGARQGGPGPGAGGAGPGARGAPPAGAAPGSGSGTSPGTTN